MAYFALFLRSEYGDLRPCPVRAETYEEVGDSTHFKRGDRVVFLIPTHLIQMIEEFEYQLPMQKRIDAYLSRRAGAATFHVHEKGCATRVAARKPGQEQPASGVVEQLTISITEPVPAHLRKRR